ncbi:MULTISPECIES: HNH endonuclease signature motif containing protein [Spirulina sp. CCY15215]|uniref:HNH endonuclease signature motif containing protein n=1 Tax=Spirulina sp. CCY15215 TaxID=2767591 RepID=UPI00195105B1|nr:HNH endonuclease signature motif containing protein [Spirulina major]
MRNLQKLNEPDILAKNKEQWLQDYLSDSDNKYKRTKYRHKEIKETLKQETGDKCIYCESKIGHNTPGDIEHKIPTSKNKTLHFTWHNLTIACTECNRRKNDYYQEEKEFLDPYEDDVESLIEHYGPIVGWKNGELRAEISVKFLELHDGTRQELMSQKIAKIEALNDTLERYKKASNPMIRLLMKKQIEKMSDRKSEYSAMVMSILKSKNILKTIQQ